MAAVSTSMCSRSICGVGLHDALADLLRRKREVRAHSTVDRAAAAAATAMRAATRRLCVRLEDRCSCTVSARLGGVASLGTEVDAAGGLAHEHAVHTVYGPLAFRVDALRSAGWTRHRSQIGIDTELAPQAEQAGFSVSACLGVDHLGPPIGPEQHGTA